MAAGGRGDKIGDFAGPEAGLRRRRGLGYAGAVGRATPADDAGGEGGGAAGGGAAAEPDDHRPSAEEEEAADAGRGDGAEAGVGFNLLPRYGTRGGRSPGRRSSLVRGDGSDSRPPRRSGGSPQGPRVGRWPPPAGAGAGRELSWSSRPRRDGDLEALADDAGGEGGSAAGGGVATEPDKRPFAGEEAALTRDQNKRLLFVFGQTPSRLVTKTSVYYSYSVRRRLDF